MEKGEDSLLRIGIENGETERGNGTTELLLRQKFQKLLPSFIHNPNPSPHILYPCTWPGYNYAKLKEDLEVLNPLIR